VHCFEWSDIWKVKYVSKPLLTGAGSLNQRLPALEGPEGVRRDRTLHSVSDAVVSDRWMKPASVFSIIKLSAASFVCTELSEINTVVSDISFNTFSLNVSAIPGMKSRDYVCSFENNYIKATLFVPI
jgi:hypothetical protein